MAAHPLSADADLAVRLALAAGEALLAARAGGATGRALGDMGDRLANRVLIDGLCAERPDDAVLSEEERDDLARCARRRSWIVDPLDGTREYADGRDDWAVHVGLAINGAPALGVVALPARGLLFRSDDPGLRPPAPPRPRIALSRSRPPEEATRVAAALSADLVPMGSAGAKAMAVVAGEADAYVHAGGQYEWDSCAPVAVALAVGLHASRLDGAPLRYNRPDPYLPDLLICVPALAAPILAILNGVG